MEPSKSRIKLLPEHLIDQIKAGEVVERPAALIKELLENSIDANSTHIDIHLVENGMDLIHVEDNGDGMSFGELPYAFCRHATSKIERFEDLYSLNSFGFRGEALASISAISKLTCVSTPKDEKIDGGKIIINGAQTMAHTPYRGHQKGTSLYIKDLFYNTPARLKFIKSKASEKNSLKKMIHSFLLANPSINFSLKWDDKEKEFYKSLDESNLDKRISQLFFKKKFHNKTLIEFSGEYEGYSVRGWFSEEASKGNAGKHHYLFVNKRTFSDRQIHQTILRTCERFWPQGMNGHYCVMISVPPSQVDVNVHPNKTQVKFFKPSVVFSLVSASIKKVLEGRKRVQQEDQAQDSLFSVEQRRESSISDFINNPLEQQSYSHEQNNLNFFSGEINLGHASQSLVRLSNSKALWFKNGIEYPLLVDLNAIFNKFWLDSVKKSYPISEGHITPLLISEPFEFKKGNIDRSTNTLKNLGLEIERLDEKVLVLRTIPSYLDLYPTRDLIFSLLKFADELDEVLTIEKLLEDYFILKENIETSFITETVLEGILNHISIDELMNQNRAIILDSQRVEGIFENA